MKKHYLVIFLLQFFVVFGQQNCVETTTDNGKKISRCWGSPLTFPEVPGIQVRVLGPIAHGFDMIGADSNKKSYYWNIEVKGTTNVLFGYVAIAADGYKTNRAGVDEFGNDDFTVPSEIDNEQIAQQNRVTQKGQITQAFTYSNSETINIKLVRITSTYGSSNSTNVNPTQSTTTGQAQRQNQQNDLTEYNRSKADLERQIAEKNAESQRKSQNYTTAMNAGISAHNSGNYAEAKNQFSIALNNCNTEEARSKAQEYYNKTNNLERSKQKITAVTDFAQTTLSALDEIVKANREKKRIKAEEDATELKNIYDSLDKINTLNDPKIFETYVDYVAQNLESLNLKFEKILSYKYDMPNNRKSVILKFKGVDVYLYNSYSTFMSYDLTFKPENKSMFNSHANAPFFKTLKEFNSERYGIYNVGKLKNTQAFIDTYNNGYKSDTYKGFGKHLYDFENLAKSKLTSSNDNINSFKEKAMMYFIGSQGVEQNFRKALEIYQQAYDKYNDKEILLSIGFLYKIGDKFIPKDHNKALEYFQNHIKDNSKIEIRVYNYISEIFRDRNSPLYNSEKGDNFSEAYIAVLEMEFNASQLTERKNEIKKLIAKSLMYSGKHYSYSNPIKSLNYYARLLKWEEINNTTAFALMEIYAKSWDKITGFKRNTDKAKYYASKVCELSNNSEESSDKYLCDLAKKYSKENFKSFKY